MRLHFSAVEIVEYAIELISRCPNLSGHTFYNISAEETAIATEALIESGIAAKVNLKGDLYVPFMEGPGCL